MRTRHILAAIATIVLLALCAGAAYAHGVALSPDGRFVYAAGRDATRTYARDPDSGRITSIDGWQPGGTAMAMSPDGRFVYVGSADAIEIFSRDAGTGLLTYERWYRGPGDDSFDRIRQLVSSRDGAQIYVTQGGDDAVLVLQRDIASGALSVRQTLFSETTGIEEIWGVATSPDGRFVYAGGKDALETFARDASTGELDPVAGRPAGGDGGPLALSPDGSRVYSGSAQWFNDVFTASLQYFGRHGPYETLTSDPQDGHLAHLSNSDEGCASGCPQGAVLGTSPDGKSLFSAVAGYDGSGDNALSQAAIVPGGVSPEHVYAQGAGFGGLLNVDAMAWSPDGRFAYVTADGGPHDGPQVDFALTALRWDQASRHLAHVATEASSPHPPNDRTAQMAIDDGALFTNDPDVTVDVKLPSDVSSFRLANDPGRLDDGGALRLRADRRYPWRLDASGGPQRLVRRVYLRVVPYYLDAPPFSRGPIELSDDIVLDQSPPRVLSAKLRSAGHRQTLELRASDNISGVKRLQVTRHRDRPGSARRFARRLRVHGSPKRLYVRAIDGAGNYGAWRVAKRSRQ